MKNKINDQPLVSGAAETPSQRRRLDEIEMDAMARVLDCSERVCRNQLVANKLRGDSCLHALTYVTCTYATTTTATTTTTTTTTTHSHNYDCDHDHNHYYDSDHDQYHIHDSTTKTSTKTSTTTTTTTTKRAGKTQKRTGMTSLGSPNVSSQSVSSFFGRNGPGKPRNRLG